MELQPPLQNGAQHYFQANTLRQESVSSAQRTASDFASLANLQVPNQLPQVVQNAPLQPTPQTQRPQVDALVTHLLDDATFVTAVQSNQLQTAAQAAVLLLQGPSAVRLMNEGFKVAASPSAKTYQPPPAPPLPMPAESEQRHGKHTDAANHKDFKIGERVTVHSSNKRTTADIVGRGGTVLSLQGNGWVAVELADTGEQINIQQRYLSHLDGTSGGTPHGEPSVGLAGVMNHGATMLNDIPDIPDVPDNFIESLSDGDLMISVAGKGQGGAGGSMAALSPMPAPAAQPTGPKPHKVREVLRRVRAELMELEEKVPWNAVRRTWRSKRQSWRRQVKHAETVVDYAQRLQEFRSALTTDEACFVGCGSAWKQQLEMCAQGRAPAPVLVAAWEELKRSISVWLEARTKPVPLSSVQLQAGTARAVHAMQEAAKKGADSLAQVPLESILNNDRDGLHAVRMALEQERKLVAAKLAAASQGQPQPDNGTSSLLLSPSNLNAGIYQPADFDSGADTEVEVGSDVTDMEDSD